MKYTYKHETKQIINSTIIRTVKLAQLAKFIDI